MKKGENNVKVKFMAITIVLALVLSLMLALAGPVAASPPPAWNVTGPWTLNFYVGLNPVSTWDVTFGQSGGTLSGNGAYSTYTWVITGSVSGSTINFTGDYGATYSGTITVDGTITAGGMSGTWSQTGSYAGSGTWTTTSGQATPVTPLVAGIVGITGTWVDPTVTFNPTGTAINMGTLYSGWNPTSGYEFTGGYGSVKFSKNSDTSATCSLSVSSVAFGDGQGHMQNQTNGSIYLPDAMLVELGTNIYTGAVDTDGNTVWHTGTLPTLASIGIPDDGNTYYFDIGAAQQITTAPAAGNYLINVTISAGYTP
jgi:hypothetical protein